MDGFIELVSRMRAKQREYFRTHDANVLLEAKALEADVDRALKEIEEDRLGPGLFGEATDG